MYEKLDSNADTIVGLEKQAHVAYDTIFNKKHTIWSWLL